MARTTEVKEIDGFEWTVTQFPASEGLKLLTQLIKLVGGPLGKAIGGLQSKDKAAQFNVMDASINFDMVGKAVAELASNAEDEKIVALIKRLLADTRCDGKEVLPKFDTLFMGRYATLFRVLSWVIGVNFNIPLADYVSNLGSKEAVNDSIRAVS